jgi:hypothetical protein
LLYTYTACVVEHNVWRVLKFKEIQQPFLFFFFQALNFLVKSFGLLNDLFSFPPIFDAGYPVFDLHLANVLFNVILSSVLESSL